MPEGSVEKGAEQSDTSYLAGGLDAGSTGNHERPEGDAANKGATIHHSNHLNAASRGCARYQVAVIIARSVTAIAAPRWPRAGQVSLGSRTASYSTC